MNADTRYDRSWLRHHVLPPIRERWPSAAHTVGRSARHLAQAQRLNAELARVDGEALVDDGRLEIAGLLSLSHERQVNVLRWWITKTHLGLPSSARLESILRDVVLARDDAQPVVTWHEGEVRRYRGRLYAMRPLPPPVGGSWLLEPGGTVRMPGDGALSLIADWGVGISAARCPGPFRVTLYGDPLPTHAPASGERRLARKVMERARLEPWLRRHAPLIYAQRDLVAVGDLWLEDDAKARAGEDSMVITWTRPA